MGKVSTKPPSGTRDFLPADIARRRHVISVIETTYEQYGFAPLETPAFENLSTLLGKYGAEGDQLLYRLLHRRDALSRALDQEGVSEADLADKGLRYDLTVPLARVIAQHPTLPRFFKRYQIQPVWRADRPGRGRFREFYQCDVDIIGTQSPLAEADIVGAVAQVLLSLGFHDFTIGLSHRRLLRGLIETAGIDPNYEETALVAVDKLDKIGPEGVAAELAQRNIEATQASRLLELIASSTDKDDRTVARNLKQQLASEAGQRSVDELLALRDVLDATPAQNHVRIRPSLARGLSYYTGPIFEIAVSDLAGSLGGGGRYDQLIGMFGKRDIPAVGFSLGLERILLVMQEREMYPPLTLGPQVMVCWFGVPAEGVVRIGNSLRRSGLRVELYPEGSTKLGKQLQYADSPGVSAAVAAIVGEQEYQTSRITLKHLASGQQETVDLDAAPATISTWLENLPTAP